jgi:hypothetical protein
MQDVDLLSEQGPHSIFLSVPLLFMPSFIKVERAMKALTGCQHIMGNLLNIEYE